MLGDRLPPPSPFFYLVEWLFELGITESSGMGAQPISWTEIANWSTLSGHVLSPGEAVALRHLSTEYVRMLTEGEDPGCPPPWVSEERNRVAVSDKLSSIFKSMIAGRKSRDG